MINENSNNKPILKKNRTIIHLLKHSIFRGFIFLGIIFIILQIVSFFLPWISGMRGDMPLEDSVLWHNFRDVFDSYFSSTIIVMASIETIIIWIMIFILLNYKISNIFLYIFGFLVTLFSYWTISDYLHYAIHEGRYGNFLIFWNDSLAKKRFGEFIFPGAEGIGIGFWLYVIAFFGLLTTFFLMIKKRNRMI